MCSCVLQIPPSLLVTLKLDVRAESQTAISLSALKTHRDKVRLRDTPGYVSNEKFSPFLSFENDKEVITLASVKNIIPLTLVFSPVRWGAEGVGEIQFMLEPNWGILFSLFYLLFCVNRVNEKCHRFWEACRRETHVSALAYFLMETAFVIRLAWWFMSRSRWLLNLRRQTVIFKVIS